MSRDTSTRAWAWRARRSSASTVSRSSVSGIACARTGSGRHARLEREDGCLRAALHVQLHEDAAHVRLDGVLADVEQAGNLLVGFALGHQLQHLGLSIGERLVRLWRAYVF